MRHTTLLFAALLTTTAACAQPMGPGMMGGGMMGNASPRHPYVMRNGLPAPYARLQNPLEPTDANISAGHQLYASQCAACHGEHGQGDGPAAAQLNPPPANLAWAMQTPMASDGFLFWTISEGGVPFGSAMPPFKSTLKEEEIWKVVLYLRTM